MNKIILHDNFFEIIPLEEGTEKRKFLNSGKLYIMKRTGAYFILHRIYDINNKKSFYRWVSVETVEGWTSVNGMSGWDSLEDAVKSALENGGKILQLDNTYFHNIFNTLLGEK